MNLGDNNKILLLGGSGLVGTAMGAVFSAAGHEVIEPTHGDLDLCRTDLLEREVLRIAPGLIINCAGLNGRQPCADNPDLAHLLNARVPGLLAACAERLGAAMVQVSSSAVFDGSKRLPYVETDEPAPVDEYGQSKHEGELRVARACSRALILRFPMLFGPRRNAGTSFVEKMTLLLQAGSPVRVSFDEFNSPLCSFEAARLTLHLVEQGRSGCLHVSSAGYESLYGIVRHMAAILGSAARVEAVPRSVFHPSAEGSVQWALQSSPVVEALSWQSGLEAWLGVQGEAAVLHA